MADVAELVAPTTLPALRQLLEQITQGQVALRLGAQARRVLTAMVEQPQRAAVSTISQLATELGVNASTLSRLAQRLGYSGFNDLQAVFRRELTEGSHFYSEQASRLQLGGSEADGLSQFTRLARQMKIPTVAVFMNIHYPPNRLHPRRCWRFGQAVRRALESWPGNERVAVVGTGGLSTGVLRQDLDRLVL